MRNCSGREDSACWTSSSGNDSITVASADGSSPSSAIFEYRYQSSTSSPDTVRGWRWRLRYSLMNVLVRIRKSQALRFDPYRYAREGGPVKTEDDPLDPTPVAAMRETEDAMAYLDRVVTEAGGIALRYGGFYGDPSDTTLIDAVRARKFPIVGSGEGVSSFIHLDDAADTTVLALDLEGPATFNIVDDEPAPIKVWLPELARILGAKPPRHFPTWLARIFAGEALVMMATEARGASNARAKRELGWTPAHPTWRQGFAETYTATGNRGR